jgi:hypothetical protein
MFFMQRPNATSQTWFAHLQTIKAQWQSTEKNKRGLEFFALGDYPGAHGV